MADIHDPEEPGFNLGREEKRQLSRFILRLRTDKAQLRQENERLKQVASAIEKVQGFASLESNWSSYGSEQITSEAIAAAVDMFSAPQVVPTFIGGVQVEWHTKHFDYELEIGPDGKVVNEDEKENERLQKQLVELREALEIYAKPGNWQGNELGDDEPTFFIAGGDEGYSIARQALASTADLSGKVLVDREQWERWQSLRPEVQRFAEQMEIELKVNDHKGGWQNDYALRLLDRAWEELVEVRDSIHKLRNNGDPRQVISECADVANMVMMIADNARREALGEEAK